MDSLINDTNGNLSNLSYTSYEIDTNKNNLFFDDSRQQQTLPSSSTINNHHHLQVVPQPKRGISQSTIDSFFGGINNGSNNSNNITHSSEPLQPPNLYQDPLSLHHFSSSHQQQHTLPPSINHSSISIAHSLQPLPGSSSNTLDYDSNALLNLAPPGMQSYQLDHVNSNNQNINKQIFTKNIYSSDESNSNHNKVNNNDKNSFRPHHSSSSIYCVDDDDDDTRYVTPFLQQQQSSSAAWLHSNNSMNSSSNDSGRSSYGNNTRAKSAPLFSSTREGVGEVGGRGGGYNNYNSNGSSGVNKDHTYNDPAMIMMMMNDNSNNSYNNLRSSSSASQQYNNNNNNSSSNNNIHQQHYTNYNNGNRMHFNSNNSYQQQKIPPHHRNSNNNNSNNNGGHSNRNYNNNNDQYDINDTSNNITGPSDNNYDGSLSLSLQQSPSFQNPSINNNKSFTSSSSSSSHNLKAQQQQNSSQIPLNNSNNSSSNRLSFTKPKESAVAELISDTCRDILNEAANHTLRAVELANTLRARVGTEILAFVREKWGGLLALLEKQPLVFLVERIPKNDLVKLIDIVANVSSSDGLRGVVNGIVNSVNNGNHTSDIDDNLFQKSPPQQLELVSAVNNNNNNNNTINSNSSSMLSGLNSQSEIFLPQQSHSSQLYSTSPFSTGVSGSSGRSEGVSVNDSRTQTPNMIETGSQYVNSSSSSSSDADEHHFQQQPQQHMLLHQQQLQQLQPSSSSSSSSSEEEIFDTMIERLNVASYEVAPILDHHHHHLNNSNNSDVGVYSQNQYYTVLHHPNVIYNIPIATTTTTAAAASMAMNSFSVQSSPSPPLVSTDSGVGTSGGGSHGMMMSGYDYRRTQSADIDRSSQYHHSNANTNGTTLIHYNNNNNNNNNGNKDSSHKDNNGNASNVYNASRCLHIGNVPANLNENQLLSEFEQFGEVETLKVVTQRNRRFAFVTYKTLEQSIIAKQRMSKIQSWKSAISFAHKESYATSGYVSSSSATPSPSINQMQQLRSPSATPPLGATGSSGGGYDRPILHAPSPIASVSKGSSAVTGLRDFYYSAAAAATLAAATASGGARTASPSLPSPHPHAATVYPPIRQKSPPLPPSYAMPIQTNATAPHSSATATFLNSGIVSVHPHRISPALPSYLLQSHIAQQQQPLLGSYRQTPPFLQQQDVIELTEYEPQKPSSSSQHYQLRQHQRNQNLPQYDGHYQPNHNSSSSSNSNLFDEDEDQYYLYGGGTQPPLSPVRPSSQMSNSDGGGVNAALSHNFLSHPLSPRQQQPLLQQYPPMTSQDYGSGAVSSLSQQQQQQQPARAKQSSFLNTVEVNKRNSNNTTNDGDGHDAKHGYDVGSNEDESHSHITAMTATNTLASVDALSVHSLSVPSLSLPHSQADFLAEVVPELFSQYSTNSAHRLLQPPSSSL